MANTCYFAKPLLFLILSIILATASAGLSFYELLEVPKNADTAAIKKAFRKKSLEYHPDKNPGKVCLD
jgi:DnaJ-domain-containing protein 1